MSVNTAYIFKKNVCFAVFCLTVEVDCVLSRYTGTVVSGKGHIALNDNFIKLLNITRTVNLPAVDIISGAVCGVVILDFGSLNAVVPVIALDNCACRSIVILCILVCYLIFTGNHSEYGNIGSISLNDKFSTVLVGVNNCCTVFILVRSINGIEVRTGGYAV